MIRTIYWQDNTVCMIDQKALPAEERILVCHRHEEVVSAIKDLTVRGAPAIGVAAAMGIALGVLNLEASFPDQFQKDFASICEEFSQARPTARNLFWAIEIMKSRFQKLCPAGIKNVKEGLVAEAMRICAEDIAINRQIGKNGSALIASGDNILTHCNAGALATAGYGTALGVIRAAWEAGKNIHVYVDETRPVLQGARLTAWELMKEGIPMTLITDNMAAFLMQQGKIDRIIVGADRIAANGDTANKIGTYGLAVLAREHQIPFYVAAPLSTIDISLADGSQIPIEKRDADEVRYLQGVKISPEAADVYNPAFDVTPHRYISAIITEAGIATAPFPDSLQTFMGKEPQGIPGS